MDYDLNPGWKVLKVVHVSGRVEVVSPVVPTARWNLAEGTLSAHLPRLEVGESGIHAASEIAGAAKYVDCTDNVQGADGALLVECLPATPYDLYERGWLAPAALIWRAVAFYGSLRAWRALQRAKPGWAAGLLAKHLPSAGRWPEMPGGARGLIEQGHWFTVSLLKSAQLWAQGWGAFGFARISDATLNINTLWEAENCVFRRVRFVRSGEIQFTGYFRNCVFERCVFDLQPPAGFVRCKFSECISDGALVEL